MTLSRTKSMLDSARPCTPVGTSWWRRPATKKNTRVIRTDAMKMRTVLLIANGVSANQMSGQRVTWVIGGKSIPRITARLPFVRSRR
jgi:hypothetical protein